MYEQYFGFVQPPFALTPDPRFLYRSESHEEAITQLLQAIKRKEGFIVLSGDIGTGKTTICRAVLEQLEPNTFASLVFHPFVSVEELLREVLLDFGVIPREAVRAGKLAGASKHSLIRALHEFLLSLVPLNGSAVLIIDEAQHLTRQVLEEVRIISNLETNQSKLLQIVLVGDLHLLEALAETDLRQLDQRVSLRAKLTPLNRDELEAYIAHRLWVARGSSSVAFEPSALDLAHRITSGIPRVINLLCDRALMIAAQMHVNRVTSPIIAEAATNLGLPVPVEQAPPSRHGRWFGMALIMVALAIAGILVLTPPDQIIAAPPPLPPAAPAKQLAAPPVIPPVPPDDAAGLRRVPVRRETPDDFVTPVSPSDVVSTPSP